MVVEGLLAVINFATHRAKFEAAKAKRKAQELTLVQSATSKTLCANGHDWKRYRQTVRVDNMKYSKGDTYFVVIACGTCKSKRIVDYRVEA